MSMTLTTAGSGWLSTGDVIVYNSGYTSAAGTSVSINSGNIQVFSSSERVGESGLTPTKGINPRILMKVLKTTKLKKPEASELSARLKKLGKISFAAQEVGQDAVFDTIAREMACIVKEQEAVSIGHGLRVERETIDRFIKMTRDRVIKFDRLENFPRTIPKSIREKIVDVKSRCIFDEFYIVYVDHTEEKVKSTKDKIREKDPILFGAFSLNTKYLYYITDWVDKYCDLTLSKMVDTIQLEDPEYELDRVPDPSEEYIAAVVAKVEKDIAELSSTNASNYLSKMLDQEKQKKATSPKKKKGVLEKVSDIITGKNKK